MNDKIMKQILDNIVIIQDTREKETHITDSFDKYNIKWIKKKLDFGDYSFMLDKNEDLGIKEPIYFNFEIAIERKNSLNELGGNIAKNRERFKKEFKRCQEHNGKLILVIEKDTYQDIIAKNYDNDIEPNSFLAMLHSLSMEYDVPFMFIDKEVTFVYIYKTFYYYLRNHIKNNKIMFDK